MQKFFFNQKSFKIQKNRRNRQFCDYVDYVDYADFCDKNCNFVQSKIGLFRIEINFLIKKRITVVNDILKLDLKRQNFLHLKSNIQKHADALDDSDQHHYGCDHIENIGDIQQDERNTRHYRNELENHIVTAHYRFMEYNFRFGQIVRVNPKPNHILLVYF